MTEIIIRHDIVHRGGRDKEGYPVNVSSADVRRVADLVKSFAEALDAELLKTFPVVQMPAIVNLIDPF
ncbi:hypothetical protein D3C85_1468850 [compost metagenome]